MTFKTLKPEDVKYIVVHCSATPPSMDIGVDEIRKMHRQRGFLDVGYHFVIRRDGTWEIGRPVSQQGAHVSGYNHCSIAVCWVGGVDALNAVEDNRTEAQKVTMGAVLRMLSQSYPGAQVVGHRDLSPDRNKDGRISPNEWLKGCPSFDVRAWFASTEL